MLRATRSILTALLFAAAYMSSIVLPLSVSAGEVLYNGIVLPDEWPPQIKKLTREPMPVPYLDKRPAVVPIDIGRQLFIDNFLIEDTTLKRTYHQATLHPSSPVLWPDKERRWEGSSGGKPCAMVFSDGVWFDPSESLFKMWYMGGYARSVCYVTSKDGITWNKPSLDVVRGTNIVLDVSRDSTLIWLDHQETDPKQRYKMLVVTQCRDGRNGAFISIRYSADGIHWGPSLAERWVSGDRSSFFYNPFRGKWVYSIRHDDKQIGRSRTYAECTDLADGLRQLDKLGRLWTNADKLDPHNPNPKLSHIPPQLYNLDAVAYESLMLGLFSVWQGDPAHELKLPKDKRNEVLLGFSRDGFHWHRPDRRPFVGVNESPGAWNWGNVQSAGGGCLVVGDKLYFYVSGRSEDRAKGPATTGLAVLRRDGFASMDADEQAGTLTTRPVTFKGKYLFVNADIARGGELRVEVLDHDGKVVPGLAKDDCVPVATDSTLAAMRWKGFEDLAALAGKPVRFRFHLTRGKLYAFWVSPQESGASHGYVAAGGPGYTGYTDTVGTAAFISSAATTKPTSCPTAPACTMPADPPKGMTYTFGTDADKTSAALFKKLGVTSVESYVTWETCESKAEDEWDWLRWDKQVDVLQDNGLKWVPFLIVGPAYATPKWFRESKDHVPCRCLEHGTDSRIQSLWNPNLPKWIDRFIGEFAKRYRDSGAIEAVLLGVQGDYGEAIYSVGGGGWTGDYHQHAGYWCNDPHALADFRSFLGERYSSVQALNKAWGTSYASMTEADFPGRGAALAEFQKIVAAGATGATGDPSARRRWLDFNDWYRASMTRWSDWWLATARKHFPKTPIYLCTGGDASPPQGSNFAEQCRVAAKHKAGVWITNEASKYSLNCALTRWVVSSGKHYGAYYGFEPAGGVDESGIVARIYNATASGADRLFEYNGNIISAKPRIDIQRANLKHLYRTYPIVPVAVWYPNNVSLTLNWFRFLDKALAFRDYYDFDFVDETMLRTDALKHYKVLVILHGEVMERQDAILITRWIEEGGRAIVAGVPRFESVEATGEPEKTLFGDNPKGRNLSKGSICRVENQEQVATWLDATLRELGLVVYDMKKDSVYGTQIAQNSFLFLNTGKEAVESRVSPWAEKSWHVKVPAGGIVRLDCE